MKALKGRARVSELAIYLSRITDLPQRKAIHWKRLAEAVHNEGNGSGFLPDGLRPSVCPPEENVTPLHVYYGNEFCQDRIPEPRELEASCAAIREAGLPLTFVTPPVNNRGCEVLMNRLTELQKWLPTSEIVINDWGTLRLVSEAFPSLVPVLGRLMTKLLREPRVTPRFSSDARPEARRALQQCSLTLPAYRRLLARFRVRRVELDNLYQGIGIDFKAMDLLPSLYVPFGYVTTGRICLMRNQHLARFQKFATPNGPCPLPCLWVEMNLTNRNAKADEAKSFPQRGNTIFYHQARPLVSRGLAWAAQQGARLVYQPEIPF